MFGFRKKKVKEDIDRFNIDTLSEGARALVHSFVYSPGKWEPSQVKQSDGKTVKDPHVWSSGDVTIIYYKEKYYGTYTIGGNKIDTPHGFLVASPHVQHFSASEQKVLVEAFEFMQGKKTGMALMQEAPILTYAELQAMTEDLIKNNKGYVLTHSNEKLRKWGERILKEAKSENGK